MAHFVKLGLEVVDLAQDISKAGDLTVSGGNRGLGTRALVEGRTLGLRGELGRYEQAIAEREATKGI